MSEERAMGEEPLELLDGLFDTEAPATANKDANIPVLEDVVVPGGRSGGAPAPAPADDIATLVARQVEARLAELRPALVAEVLAEVRSGLAASEQGEEPEGDGEPEGGEAD